MADSYMQALIGAVEDVLTAGAETWSDRVYKDYAPLSDTALTRPYVVCKVVSGGMVDTQRELVLVLIQVVCTAESQAVAYAAQDRIHTLLSNNVSLDGGASWNILKLLQSEKVIDFKELVEGQDIYHAGLVFRVWMEAK